jgi:hypothetical protein
VNDSLLSSVIWDGGALRLRELAALWQTGSGYALRGSVVGALHDACFSARYDVRCTPEWETTSAWVELIRPPVVLVVQLIVREGLRWSVAGVEREDLQGIRDVDIQFTPVTNTLPIRRTRLNVGEEASVEAAWIQFPDLNVAVLPQTYRRIGDLDFEYRSGEFQARIRVDDEGLVERYGSFWRRLLP